MRTQLNVRVTKAIKQRVTKDRKPRIATVDVIVEVALENFFTKYSPEERLKFYANHSYRPYGMKAA